MASKINVNNTVTERRLRPIYDWLDNGNHKKALQEADKVLKKQPSNQCARVLKALALLRLGKENDCLSIMDKLRSEVPCEDSILQVMSICYREIHQPDKISEVYEAAAKANPHNEELLTHLFMCYVRLGDYKKQQQTALALYKLKPKNPYYFWAVMSIVMQAISSDEKLTKSISLPLAERMVLKLVNEGKLEAEQEVQLYLMILEFQGKNEEMLKVLSSPLSSHLSSISERKATLLLKLERFPEATKAYMELIQENIDNWMYYLDYLTAALEFHKPSECMDYLNNIISTCENKVRGPYLAQLELFKRLSKEDNFQTDYKLTDLMYQYFSKFGEKGCIVGDLRLYLHLLTSTEKIKLLQEIENDIGIKSDEYPSSIKQMQKHIHLEQLKRICGFHHPPMADINVRKEYIDRLCKLYNKGNELCPVEERLPTDFCPADSYILIATHLLHQLWIETNEASYLYRAIWLLETALITSPANFHIKILLVRVYLETGLVGAADHVYTLLDVKHIQLDSLGHLHAPLLAPLGHLTTALKTLDHSAKFFIANYRDSADHLTYAYKYGSFLKIQEFVELRETLEKSLHFAMTTVDKMLLELSWSDSSTSLISTLNNMNIQPYEDTITWETFKDNRDLEVVVSWEPLSENNEDCRMQKETRLCMIRLLAVRSLMLRILAATAELEASMLLARLSIELKRLDSEEIPSLLEKFDSPNRRNQSHSILVPLDAVLRLREAHQSKQLITLAHLAEYLSQSPFPNSDCIEMLRTALCFQAMPVPCQETTISYTKFLLRATTCSESLAIVSAICTICTINLQSRNFQKKNKKKLNKNIEPIEVDESRQSWQEVAALLKERLKNFDAVLSNFENHQLQTELDAENQTTSRIIEMGQASLRESCKLLKSRIRSTSKLLSSVKS